MGLRSKQGFGILVLFLSKNEKIVAYTDIRVSEVAVLTYIKRLVGALSFYHKQLM